MTCQFCSEWLHQERDRRKSPRILRMDQHPSCCGVRIRGIHLLKKIFDFFSPSASPATEGPWLALTDWLKIKSNKVPMCRTCCTAFPSSHFPPSSSIRRTPLQAKRAKEAAVRRSNGGHVKIQRFLRCHDRRVEPRARNSRFHDRVSWNYCLISANALPIHLLCCSGWRRLEKYTFPERRNRWRHLNYLQANCWEQMQKKLGS